MNKFNDKWEVRECPNCKDNVINREFDEIAGVCIYCLMEFGNQTDKEQ